MLALSAELAFTKGRRTSLRQISNSCKTDFIPAGLFSSKIKSTKQYLQQAKDEGHMIILTTARPEEMRDHTIHELYFNNVPYDRLIMGIERGPRYLINDLSPKEPGDRAIAINLKRDEGI